MKTIFWFCILPTLGLGSNAYKSNDLEKTFNLGNDADRSRSIESRSNEDDRLFRFGNLKGNCNPEFVDSRGNNCKAYANNRWCTTAGKHGPGWKNSWGTFYDYLSTKGQTAFVCPQCGCGRPCMDTDNGSLDQRNLTCDWYYSYPIQCGYYDDDDFTARWDCCACKPYTCTLTCDELARNGLCESKMSSYFYGGFDCILPSQTSKKVKQYCTESCTNLKDYYVREVALYDTKTGLDGWLSFKKGEELLVFLGSGFKYSDGYYGLKATNSKGEHGLVHPSYVKETADNKEAIKYQELWKGLCYDGQQAEIPMLRNVTPKDCENKCTSQSSCIGYASHPNNHCYITYKYKMMAPWSNKKSHQHFTCYEKIKEKLPVPNNLPCDTGLPSAKNCLDCSKYYETLGSWHSMEGRNCVWVPKKKKCFSKRKLQEQITGPNTATRDKVLQEFLISQARPMFKHNEAVSPEGVEYCPECVNHRNDCWALAMNGLCDHPLAFERSKDGSSMIREQCMQSCGDCNAYQYKSFINTNCEQHHNGRVITMEDENRWMIVDTFAGAEKRCNADPHCRGFVDKCGQGNEFFLCNAPFKQGYSVRSACGSTLYVKW